VQVLDRKKALPLAYDPSEPEPPSLNSARGACVRDVSWHSSQPVLMSVAWATRHEGSIVARHEWKGLGKMSQRLEDWVDKQSAEYIEQTRASEAKQARAAEARSRRLPGAFEEEDIDDDDDGDYVSDEE
jgi:WD repeat-containing protein 23